MSVSGNGTGIRFGVATSTNRPATPFDGQVIYETDTDRLAAYDSSAWAYKNHVVVCTSSTRPSSPFDGQMIYETDTDRMAVYDSSAWVYKTQAVATGLVLVKSETTITAASSVTADSVFTSSYTNYRINLVYNTSTSNDVRLRVRVGGVSASTSYNYQTFRSNSTTNTGANTIGDTSFYAGANSNGTRRCYATIDVSGPALADQTTFQANTALFQGSNAGQVFLVAGMHDAATAYDGFELLVASGTFSGSYTVYGYCK